MYVWLIHPAVHLKITQHCLSTVIYIWASLVTQMLKNLPAMQETWVWSLGQEDTLRRERLPTPIFLPGESHAQRSLAGYSPWGCKKLRHDWATKYNYNPIENKKLKINNNCLETPKVSFDRWMNKQTVYNTKEYFSLIKRGELSTHEQTCKKLKCVFLSGCSQSIKATLWFQLYDILEVEKLKRQEKDQWLSWLGEQKEQGMKGWGKEDF